MSSQISLTLRPPPNVEHVDGYPGIPPGPNRPQASVKGSVELRTGPAGVKAKWVRIALNKIETLPGGGQVASFSDFVGPSPVTLWQANPDAEYGLLGSQDFSFNIRIPESTPPSVNLASGELLSVNPFHRKPNDLQDLSGIRYELVASVCTKGKKVFLRRRKSNIISTTTGIIIDKHELHSTWPVYNQPETRHLTQDGVTLHVERQSTCYGPGDRIAVVATVKSESLNTIILRGFEIMLKETSIFRSGPYTNSGKKAAPQVRVLSITEAKFPVNVTLYGGNQHSSELACVLSPNHTTTTLNTARHIDVTYVLCVKALMGTGTAIIMELPIVISNWQRVVSQEALRRIGPVPSLSLTSAAYPMHEGLGDVGHRSQPSNEYNQQTAPAAYGGGVSVNEFGGLGSGLASGPSSNTMPNGSSSYTPSPSLSYTNSANPVPTSRARGGSGTQNRLTIANDVNGEVERKPSRSPGTGSGVTNPKSSTTGGESGASQWMSAEDEKRMLYEKAKDAAERVQGQARLAGSSAPPQQQQPTPAQTPQPAKPSTVAPKRWLTAEEEKLQLYERAQAAVQRTQGLQHTTSVTSSATKNGRSDSIRSNDTTTRPTGSSSSSLYPMASSSSQPPIASGSSSAPAQAPKPKKPMQTYPTAEQEKAAMKLYEEAQQAVARTQNAAATGSSDIGGGSSSTGPVAYDALYPSAVITGGAGGEPPAFNQVVNGSSGAGGSALSEKERLKRAYEAQDAQAAAAVIRERQQQQQPQMGGGSRTPPNYSPPPFDTGAGSFKAQQQQGLSEKEILKRKLEAQDRAAQAAFAAVHANQQQQVAQRSPSIRSTPTSPRTPQTPPPSGSRILTAVEEKAMLAARYAAEEKQQQQRSPPPRQNSGGSYFPQQSQPHSGSSSPPPLKPRPPKEYIQETQEEDARVSRFALGGGDVRLMEERD